MVDPISVGASSLAKAATSAVTKKLTSKAGVQLGSRDERRQVYARFQAAVTDTYSRIARTHLEMRLYAVYIGKRRWPFVYRPAGGERVARESLRDVPLQHSELLQAYLDLRLVANPAPLESADAVLDRLNEVLDLPLGTTPEAVTAAVSNVAKAQRSFTDVCRDDLWYLPRWWQLYRREWWRRRRVHRRPDVPAVES
ncbi:hypothetical protein [Streptomyces sp. FBKL.4005]|uniref:hypothetical protein n=1 Tax=Streptomyces sp. FBKL.4005 TaxID=2015515 RepID=UPI001676E76B|nr:hypothetical protein [Streptomyces sp. FBKL.4005]